MFFVFLLKSVILGDSYWFILLKHLDLVTNIWTLWQSGLVHVVSGLQFTVTFCIASRAVTICLESSGLFTDVMPQLYTCMAFKIPWSVLELCFYFLTGSHHACWLTLILWSSCFCLPNTRITALTPCLVYFGTFRTIPFSVLSCLFVLRYIFRFPIYCPDWSQIPGLEWSSYLLLLGGWE